MLSLDDLFRAGESPYYAMYTAGLKGIPLRDIEDNCYRKGIPLREKDIQNWQRGFAKSDSNYHTSVIDVFHQVAPTSSIPTEKLCNYPLIQNFNFQQRRWFPCTADNKPMVRWGDFNNLYPRDEALALSACGYVGQNILCQDFIVIDIDGEGHGVKDMETINFGLKYAGKTECWVNPKKLGSMHLYFKVSRLIPTYHFRPAKIDFLGNARNTAVYQKNKISNWYPRTELTEDIWQDILAYAKYREDQYLNMPR